MAERKAVYVSSEMHKWLKLIAAQQDRSISEIVQPILEREIRRQANAMGR